MDNTDIPHNRLPARLQRMIDEGSGQEVLIGWSGVRVFRLSGGRYAKIATLPTLDLRPEKERLEWLAGRLPVPQVLQFSEETIESQTRQVLVITEIPGLPAFDESLKGGGEPHIIALLAEGLRMIHRIDPSVCPFDERIKVMIEQAHTRLVEGRFDAARLDPSRRGRDAEELYAQLLETRPPVEDLVFAHGDYCLPNVLINPGSWALTGFIDWGSAGVADRYLDLGLAARSITVNLGAQWVQPFFEAYGIHEIDAAKVEFYQLLDEFF